MPVLRTHEPYQASRRRPRWVRCFVEDALGRRRRSSGLERRGRGSPRRPGAARAQWSWARSEAALRRSRLSTRRTGHAQSAKHPHQATVTHGGEHGRLHGHAPNGGALQRAQQESRSGSRTAPRSALHCQPAGTASRRPALPGGAAARQAARATKNEAASQVVIASRH